jgi:hypothetical protein
MSPSYQINVRAETQAVPWVGLARIFEGLLPVKFSFSAQPELGGAGEIIIEDENELMAASSQEIIPSLRVSRDEKQPSDSKPIDTQVHFTEEPDVPFPFRGRSLHTKVAVKPKVLSLNRNQIVLAENEMGPVWAVSIERGVKQFSSGFALPKMPDGGSLIDVLNGERFLEILPLLHWLREICSASMFDGPPLRACFIFDDPNLHWPRYGFVDFRQIAAQAAKENYHVSFATIPLDTWFTHGATAELFRANASRLSLLIHGNDHLKHELARSYTQPARVSLLAQAIHRIERLENKTGLPVCRVMVPPHGACSEEMLAELARSGFEAACISHGSLRAHNRGRLWTKTLGYLPSEWIQGCPVLPRWGMAGDTTNIILLAAFLGQPIILRGHHQDLKNGIELLNELASFINGLGSVSWSNMTRLCRTNYQWRMDGNTCRVKPLGRTIVFRVPVQSTRLIIEGSESEFQTGWQISVGNGTVQRLRVGESISLPDTLGGEVSMMATPVMTATMQNGANGSTSWAFLRRLLTEGRDRFMVQHN